MLAEAGATGESKLRGLPVVLRGLRIREAELDQIRNAIGLCNGRGRTQISIDLCESLGFKQGNGWPKERAMRDVLRRLDALGLIRLPPSKKSDVSRNKKGENVNSPKSTGEVITHLAVRLNPG